VKNGITTTGTVIGVRSDQITSRGSEYRDPLHRPQRHRTRVRGDLDEQYAGYRLNLTVSYSPDNPEHAADLSVGSITFLVVGMLLALGEAYWAYRGGAYFFGGSSVGSSSGRSTDAA
jgi:hypothetical protein